MFLIGIDWLTTTIADGTSLSAALGLGSKTLCGIILPSTWNAASLTFQCSPDGTTFYEVVTAAAGAAATVVAAAGQFVQIDPALWHGINLVKIRSGTSGAPVAQTGAQVVTAVVRSPIT
jgi:hypothetical protein